MTTETKGKNDKGAGASPAEGRTVLREHYFTALDGVVGGEMSEGRRIGDVAYWPIIDAMTICVLVLSDSTCVHGTSYWHEAQDRTRSEDIERALARHDALRRLESHPTVEAMAEAAIQREADAIRLSRLHGERRYPLKLERDDAGNVMLTCDDVPEFACVGRTIEMAMRDAEDAMATARMIYERDGRPFPKPSREPLPGERWVTVREGDA